MGTDVGKLEGGLLEREMGVICIAVEMDLEELLPRGYIWIIMKRVWPV